MDRHDKTERPRLCFFSRLFRSLALAAIALAAINATTPSSAAETKNDHEIRRLSKFEARQIRHSCRDKAIEKGLRGSERASFLTRCYFGRARSFRRECTQLGATKGLEKTALQDFVRSCVKERRRPKNDAPQ